MGDTNLHPLRMMRDRRNLTQKRLAEETGVGAQTILRAEHNRPINAESRRLLCEYFNMTAAELGLVSSETDRLLGEREAGSRAEKGTKVIDEIIDETTARDINTQQHIANAIAQGILIAVRKLENPDMDRSRRCFLQMLGITGSAFLTPGQDLIDQPLWDRLSKALIKPSSIDEFTIYHLEELTKDCWRLLSNAGGMYTNGLLHYVGERLHTVTALLEHSLPAPAHNRLATTASELSQIMGEIYFDLKDNYNAEQYYNVAIKAAQSAQNDLLQAVALGRKCFIPIYTRKEAQALPYLQEAQQLLRRGAPDATHSWLAAIEAEVLAGMRKSTPCLKALERSEFYADRGRPGESSYTRFNGTILLGYKGVCYIKLKQPREAQNVLNKALISIDQKRTRHKSIIFIDTASSYIQQGEIEEACQWASDALNFVVQMKSARVFQRVLGLRQQLEPWKTHLSVRTLDEQINALQGYFSRQSTV